MRHLTDPLAPTPALHGSIWTRPILFASLSVTLFVVFVAVLGKQWSLYYTISGSPRGVCGWGWGLGVGAPAAAGWLKAGRVEVLLGPHNSGGWPVFGRNSPRIGFRQIVSVADPNGSLIRGWTFECACRSLADSHSLHCHVGFLTNYGVVSGSRSAASSLCPFISKTAFCTKCKS